MNHQTRKEILAALEDLYPNPKTELNFSTPFQLLVATILSAQCTDLRVNKITAELFAKHPTAGDIANLPLATLEEFIRSAGLWKNKAKNISQTAQELVESFDGEVPRSRELLQKLPGVGRKTANVVLANAFGIPAFAVDTHVHRVSNRLGLAKSQKVEETERQLTKLIPKSKWADGHHWLILHGRRVCTARKPKCNICPLAHLCPSSHLETNGKKD